MCRDITGLGNMLFAHVMSKLPMKTWSILNQKFWATTTFSDPDGESSFVQLKYTGQMIHEYMEKWVSLSARLTSMDVATN